MAALSARSWAGPDDLRAMQAIVSAAWNGPRRPLVSCTVGDLEWWVAGAGPDADLRRRLRLWSLGDEVVGWGWFGPPASLDWFVAAGVGADDETTIREAILAWHAEQAGAFPSGDAGPPAQVTAWAADGWAEQAFLEARGWVATGTALTQYHQGLERDIPEPVVPAGYRVRTMAGPAEIPARVEVHRSAFAPSRMTVEKYAILVEGDHYAYDRDVVVEAPDGSFAAFTMAWSDPLAAIGEFEPVGTHADHRRLGLGRAANLHGLRLLRDGGARDAMVFSDRSNEASEALYRAVGFREIAVHREYARDLGAPG